MELTPVPPILGPSMRKKLVPRGLPVMAWLIAGSPMNPAGGPTGGGDLNVSHVRNGPTLDDVRTRPKPSLLVKLIVPVSDAMNVLTPYGWVTVYVAPGVRPAVTRMRRRANTTCAPLPSATVSVAPPKAPSSACVRVAFPTPPAPTLLITATALE